MAGVVAVGKARSGDEAHARRPGERAGRDLRLAGLEQGRRRADGDQGGDHAAQVRIQLDFIKPFEGHNVTDFTLVPRGDTTEVTWLMRGPAPFVSKLMGVFVDMDKMIGKDFETGLANLKAAAEK